MKHRYFRLGEDLVLGLLDDAGCIWKAGVVVEVDLEAQGLFVDERGVRVLVIGKPQVTDEIWESVPA